MLVPSNSVIILGITGTYCPLMLTQLHENAVFVQVLQINFGNVNFLRFVSTRILSIIITDEYSLKCDIFEVIYQTRETVFHRDIQTPRRELKIRRAAEYF